MDKNLYRKLYIYYLYRWREAYPKKSLLECKMLAKKYAMAECISFNEEEYIIDIRASLIGKSML